MRIYILLIFVGLMGLTVADHFSRFKREIISQSGSLIRQKREGFFEELFEPSCESKCDEELSNKVNATGFEGADNPFAFLDMEPNVLEEICNTYEASKSCYSACPTGSSSTSTGYKIMCEEQKSEILKHLPCYKKADLVSENECEAQCGSLDLIMNVTEASMNSTNVEDFASFEKMFDQLRPLCKFLECAIDCGANVFTRECTDDPDAGKFFKEMTEIAGTTLLHELEELESSLGMDLMPKECREIMNSSEEKVMKDGGSEGESGDDLMSSLLKPDSSSGSDTLAMVQKLVDQQSVIYEKTSRNLDVELEKMELEMKLLKKQLGE